MHEYILHEYTEKRGLQKFSIVTIFDGRVVDPGPKTSMFTPPHHEYTDLLLSSVPEIDPN